MFAFIVIVKLSFIFSRSSQSLGFIFLIADDYLNAAKQIWWKWKHTQKSIQLEYLVSGLKVVKAAGSSGHKHTHLSFTSTIPVLCSLLHCHAAMAVLNRTDTPSPAVCLLSHFSLGERSFLISFLGDSFSWKRNLYNSRKAFWEG